MYALLEESSLGVSVLLAKCVKNPAYIHLGPEEERHQDSPGGSYITMYTLYRVVKCSRMFVHMLNVY